MLNVKVLQSIILFFPISGFSDKVVCFACGVGLSDWSPEADPALQHAKASPKCSFLLQSKGKEFINSAQNIQVTSLYPFFHSAHRTLDVYMVFTA